jgi:hypothetical protein
MKYLVVLLLIIVLIYYLNINQESYNNTFDNDTCILLTMTIKLNTNYNKENNSIQNRLNMYTHVINKYLFYTNMDIYIVESSGYDFHQFNNNPRIKICSFISKNNIDCKNCEATPYEAESILYAFNYFKLYNKFKNIIKITGRYYIPNISLLINNIPSDAEIFFQNNNYFLWSTEQPSEIFGCNTKYLENIMETILENSKKNINFEKTLYNLKNYKIYHFPKIKLESPIRRGGDNKLMNYL